MLKKIDQARLFLQENAQVFRCPICHSTVSSQQNGLICESQHRFDLSKKGTLYFLLHAIQSDYQADLFASRGRMIHSGMYEPLVQLLFPYLNNKKVIDIGCGEGSFLSLLSKRGQPHLSIGFDIAKEGIYQATNQENGDFWCTADLTNLPFADQSIDCLLNIFSPSNYQEFKRILAPNGVLVKVVPGANYLQELRSAFYPEDLNKQNYSNERVVEKFKQAFDDVVIEKINYTFDIPKERRMDFLEMSPLEWGVDPKRKEYVKNHPLEVITIDLEVLVGRIAK